jgi:hypothetical protein
VPVASQKPLCSDRNLNPESRIPAGTLLRNGPCQISPEEELQAQELRVPRGLLVVPKIALKTRIFLPLSGSGTTTVVLVGYLPSTLTEVSSLMGTSPALVGRSETLLESPMLKRHVVRARYGIPGLRGLWTKTNFQVEPIVLQSKVGFSPTWRVLECGKRIWKRQNKLETTGPGKKGPSASAASASEAFGCRCWGFLVLAPACAALSLGPGLLLSTRSRPTHIL